MRRECAAVLSVPGYTRYPCAAVPTLLRDALSRCCVMPAFSLIACSLAVRYKRTCIAERYGRLISVYANDYEQDIQHYRALGTAYGRRDRHRGGANRRDQFRDAAATAIAAGRRHHARAANDGTSKSCARRSEYRRRRRCGNEHSTTLTLCAYGPWRSRVSRASAQSLRHVAYRHSDIQTDPDRQINPFNSTEHFALPFADMILICTHHDVRSRHRHDRESTSKVLGARCL